MRSTPRRALALAASLTLVGVLGACGGDSADHGTSDHGTTVSAGASASPRDADVIFAQGMVPHHEQAVDMADIALEHPDVSDDVRRIASAVKSAQDPEIEQMQDWLQKWGAPATGPADAHAGHGMMTDADLADLEEAAGEDFNRMWMELMIEHHEGAITMAQDVLETTEDAAVRALAEAIISAQEAEIEEMRQLLG